MSSNFSVQIRTLTNFNHEYLKQSFKDLANSSGQKNFDNPKNGVIVLTLYNASDFDKGLLRVFVKEKGFLFEEI